MPRSLVPDPIPDPWLQQEVLARHGLQATAGGFLLTTGRRALHEFGRREGVDVSTMVVLLAEAVAAWADIRKVRRTDVQQAADALDKQFLHQDYRETNW